MKSCLTHRKYQPNLLHRGCKTFLPSAFHSYIPSRHF